MYLTEFTIFLFVLFFNESKCKCRHSYMTFCDDLSDLRQYNVENWTELVVGYEDADRSVLRKIDFDSLSLDRFEKLTSLTVVRQINDIKTYTFGLDEEDTILENLNLFANEIKRIRFTTFDNMRLRKLNLANNSIEYIHKEAFYNCEIQTIDLSNNKLEMIENNVFTEEFLGNSTKELIFRNNRLESMEPGCFPSSLEILNLDYNNLRTLQYKIFENLHNLRELTISHNQFNTLPNLKILKQVEVIDFSYNRITGFNSEQFNELSQVRILDLSHNMIDYPLTFSKFNFPQRHPSLQISLAFNKMTHLMLADDSFRHHIVFLYGNPWDCKCWSILEKFMIEKNVKRNKCDLQFFGTGQVPYCIDLSWNDCTKVAVRHPNFTTSDIQQFSEVVKRRENVVGCSLSPRRL